MKCGTSFGWLLAVFSWSTEPSAAPTVALPAGEWDATVAVNDVSVPFRFELSAAQTANASGAFFNGDDRVRSTSGTYSGNHLSLRFDQLGSTLEATWAGQTLSGSYARAGRSSYAFSAVPHTARAAISANQPSIAGQWEIAISGPKGENAWWLFVRQSGAEVSASILRVDGDTGFLAGRFKNGKFVLSHFSGARPLLLEVTPEPDGSLSLLEDGKKRYSALKSAAARSKHLPEPADPSRWTSVKDPTQPLRFSAPDLTGKIVSEADPVFKGKVVLVNIMGSWCPNCHDEAPFLVELYRRYHARGLEIVALSFEDGEQLTNPTRLRAFIQTYRVPYITLLGGEPGDVRSRSPQAVNLNTWPATFFVGRDGLVHGAHAGFASKATGKAHEQLKIEVRGTIEKLLAQKP